MNCLQENENLGIYAINYNAQVLCQECHILAKEEIDKEVYYPTDDVEENYFMGIIGAIIGSLVGVASIILLDRINFVASISGSVMGYGALKGYEFLANNLSKKGIIISVIIMIFMTFFTVGFAMVINVALTFNASIIESYQYLIFLFQAKELNMGPILWNLLFVFVFVGIGAITVINTANLKVDSKLGYWELD